MKIFKRTDLAYFFVSIIIKALASFPMFVLYFFSDVLFVITFYGIKYRRKVVAENLRYAFPEKSDSERHHIAKEFYRYLADALVEVLKTSVASAASMQKYYSFDSEIFKPYFEEKKTVYLALSHQFNWELGAWLLNDRIPQTWAVIYTPLSSAVFERFFYKIRTATGALFYSPKQMTALLKRARESPMVIGLAADQSPAHLPSARWFSFLNRPVPFHAGIEDLARRFGGAVIFMEIIRERRGRYRAECMVYTEDAKSLPEGQITQAYAEYIEASIRRQPANYLWSHRRWKHSDKYNLYNP